MKTAIKHGAVIRCDASNNVVEKHRCAERFQSNSFAMVIREQAKAAGWGRVPAWQVPEGHNGSRLHDVCPDHKAAADVFAANREATLEAEREKRKAEREADLAAERTERANARAAKKAAQLAEAEVRAKRKADHAARKALLLQQRLAKRAKRKKGAA